MILSPLEQFEIISLIPVQILCFDFSITNSLLVNIITLTIFSNIVYFLSSNENYLKKIPFFFIPNNWQILIETLYEIISKLVFDNVSLKGEKYFPYIAVLFTFILFTNLIGLVPYSFTVTSHLIITFALAFASFIGINIIGLQRHKQNMLSLIIPTNTSFGLALILVPIEFISYIAKPISLGVRLFVNLMAGHTLLKVIAGFAWSMLLLENFLSFAHIIPLLILTILMSLELGVALVQAYVFTILTCIYLNDSINLH
jgi:ATP synthase subunit 6